MERERGKKKGGIGVGGRSEREKEGNRKREDIGGRREGEGKEELDRRENG